MKPKEIREMTGDELSVKLKDLSRELFNIKFQYAAGQVENTMKIPHLKKDIARIKTIIKEKGAETRG